MLKLLWGFFILFYRVAGNANPIDFLQIYFCKYLSRSRRCFFGYAVATGSTTGSNHPIPLFFLHSIIGCCWFGQQVIIIDTFLF